MSPSHHRCLSIAAYIFRSPTTSLVYGWPPPSQAFFQEHSNYLKNELYITGESYAGHYIPAATERIHRGNKEKHGLHLNLKYYDIRKKCEGSLCFEFSNMEKYLNKKLVRNALGVGNRKFVSCNPFAYEALLTDLMKKLEVGVPALIDDGIKVLVYAGEYDLICNWLGNYRWVSSMKWSSNETFVVVPFVPFTVDGQEAGLLNTSGPLSFLKVFNAGLLVPAEGSARNVNAMDRRETSGWIEHFPS